MVLLPSDPYNAYLDENGEASFPEYPDTDRRQLVLYILSEIGGCPSIVPEDVPTLIKCLNVPEEQIVDMYDYIDNYFEQFENDKRFNNARSRFNFVNDQRKEAIEKGQPIPIKPMGIEIDLYYKKAP